VPAPPSSRVEVNAFPGAPPQERELVEMVAGRVDAWEGGMGREFHERCNRFYSQYRGFRKFRDAWTKSGPNDKDGVLYDAKKHWGAQLHIPLSYRTIEHMVPAAIAHRPRMLYLPAKQRWEENVETVRYLIDRQQEQIDIDLAFQAVMRSGRIYGLGVGKTYWRKEYASRRGMVKSRFSGVLEKTGVFKPNYYLGDARNTCVFDDPDFDDVDVFDFMWDPYGSSMSGSSRCAYVVHRIWMGLGGCLDRVQSGVWNTESAKLLTEDKLRNMSGAQKYDEIWGDRMLASGFSSYQLSGRGDAGEQIHEVWEYHDGQRVLTVLDRQVLVQNAENPCVGVIPFHVYRPTPLQRQMVGIGDLEPLEHLNRELDTLRSQRRDAATLALCAGFAYDSSAVDEEDLVFGPAAAIEVRNARPDQAIMPLQVRDVPGSSWQEENVIRTDFDAVSGINEALVPQTGGVSTTATEAQLVQAALSRRIQLGSRRFEIEVVRGTARCFLLLDQRMIRKDREAMRAPDYGLDMDQAMSEGRWRWVDVGPGGLMGEFEIIPDGGSMAARNIPQDRQDAQMLLQNFLAGPAAAHIEPSRPILKALELFGEKDPEAWLRKKDAPIPPMALQILQQMGVDPRLIEYATQTAQQQDPRIEVPEQEQGPGVEDVNQLMGAAA
jgi:hypothetical protein